MATDPEALYTQVLQEEQQKGSSPPVAEGRAKAARARAEAGSPHPTEPKWWPGAQPHLEGGDGAAPAEEAAEEPAAEEAPAEEAAPAEAEAPAADASEPPAAEAPAAEQPPDLGAQEAPPAAAPQAQPAAATAPQPAAAAAPAAAATATELPPDQRPAGVTHGTPGGNRLRPEDSVGTDAQFDAQQAMYRRRKMIDELVATGVPAVTAADASRPRGTSLASVLVYLVILVVAAAFLVSQKDALGSGEGGGGGEHAAEENGEGGGGGLTISAANAQFDTDHLTLPAQEETELEFVNEDSLQHNVSIYEDDSASNALFEGQIIPGGQTITYSIPPLEEGEFYFQCDVHPGMNGDVTVE